MSNPSLAIASMKWLNSSCYYVDIPENVSNAEILLVKIRDLKSELL